MLDATQVGLSPLGAIAALRGPECRASAARCREARRLTRAVCG